MHKIVSSCAILISLIALALVWFRPPFESAPRNEAGAPVAIPNGTKGASDPSLLAELEVAHERIRGLESRINSLQAEQEVLAARLEQATPGTGVEDGLPAAELVGPIDGNKVAMGLVNLEQKTESLEQDLVELGVFDHFAKKAEKLQKDYERVFDETRSTKERLKSAMDLKKAGRIDAEVASTLIGMWDESQDDYATYFLLDSLEGVVDADLRDRIFEYLPEAESPKMRLRAVSTLEPMLEDPEVERWFGHLAANDPDEKVRDSVARRLQRHAEPAPKE